jgi:hypothetical protein
MDYLARIAAAFTILGISLHQLGKWTERRKQARRWRVGRDWTHWVQTKEGRAIFRSILHNINQE